MKYIHYGDDKFDINKFNKVLNRPESTKPFGGFWGSRKNAVFGWKEWCTEIDLKSKDLTKKLQFSLLENAKILVIDNIKCLDNLPQNEDNHIVNKLFVTLDFEKLSKQYDAIEVLISEDERLYELLYGWDCDSILVINHNIIITEN